MPLTEAVFTALVDPGCPKCSSKSLVVETYVVQKLPLLAGELYGSAFWGYKGEELVQGTFRIACSECEHELYASSACPRCEEPDMLAKALEAENDLPMPVRCTACKSEQITASAYVPATVIYEGKRGAKARTDTLPEDPGFHGFKAECRSCKNSTERKKPCPVCGTDR